MSLPKANGYENCIHQLRISARHAVGGVATYVGQIAALIAVLTRLRPALSLEVGTYRAGSLQVLSRFSERVLSIDIDPDAAHCLQGRFVNVEFRTGDSVELLPKAVQEMNPSGPELEFVLIDGSQCASEQQRVAGIDPLDDCCYVDPR